MSDSGAGDVLRRVAGQLDAAGIPHMVVGSFASSYHGVPRSTHDLDIVIDPTLESLSAFVAGLFPDAYYADLDMALDALRRRAQFNVIDLRTGWKVDLIIRKNRPFSREEISRRRKETLFGVSVFVATPEDTVIAKLEWARAAASDLQLRDAAGILQVCGLALDVARIERWVEDLALQVEWAKVRGDGT